MPLGHANGMIFCQPRHALPPCSCSQTYVWLVCACVHLWKIVASHQQNRSCKPKLNSLISHNPANLPMFVTFDKYDGRNQTHRMLGHCFKDTEANLPGSRL